MNEIQIPYGIVGATVYVHLRNATGQVYNTVTPAFETWNDANWADYAIVAAEQGASGIYAGDMPAVASGVYSAYAYEQQGGSPAIADAIYIIGCGELSWNGSSVSDLSEIQGLLGKNVGLRNPVYSGANLLSYDLCLYDSAVNAATNDGATGLLHQYSVVNTYSGSNLTSSVTTRVS